MSSTPPPTPQQDIELTQYSSAGSPVSPLGHDTYESAAAAQDYSNDNAAANSLSQQNESEPRTDYSDEEGEFARRGDTKPREMKPKTGLLDSWVKGRDGRRFLLIERVHYLLTFPFFAVYAAIIIGAFAIGFIAGPNTYIHNSAPVTTFQDARIPRLPDYSYFNGTAPLTTTIQNVEPLNQQLVVVLHLYKHHYFENLTLHKHDLKYRVRFYGEKVITGAKDLLNNNPELHHKTVLECREKETKCSGIPVAFQSITPDSYRNYYVEVDLLNADQLSVNLSQTHFPQHFNHSLHQHNFTLLSPLVSLLKGEARFEWIVYNPDASNWELGWRYALLIVSLPFTVFFFVYSFVLTEVKQWSMEQWWVGCLLLCLNLYNNPLYALQIFDPSFLLTFLNTFFVTLFMCYLLLTILVVIHGAIKRPEDRSLAFFYVPKVILIVVVFIVLLFFFIYLSFRQSLDPSYSSYDDTSADRNLMEYLGVFLIAALAIYVLAILYYTFRGIGMWRRGALKPTIRNRFWITFLFTLVTVGFTIVDVIALVFGASGEEGTSAAQFLIFFLLYNGYSLMMGVFHLPTLRVKQQYEFEEEEEGIEKEESAAFYAELEDETLDNTYAEQSEHGDNDGTDADDTDNGEEYSSPVGEDKRSEAYDDFAENQL